MCFPELCPALAIHHHDLLGVELRPFRERMEFAADFHVRVPDQDWVSQPKHLQGRSLNSDPVSDDGIFQSGPDEIGPVETGPDESGPDEIGPDETGPGEIGPDEIGPVEIGPDESGPDEIGPVESGPDETGPVEIGPAETGPVESGPDEIGPVESGPRVDRRLYTQFQRFGFEREKN